MTLEEIYKPKEIQKKEGLELTGEESPLANVGGSYDEDSRPAFDRSRAASVLHCHVLQSRFWRRSERPSLLCSEKVRLGDGQS